MALRSSKKNAGYQRLDSHYVATHKAAPTSASPYDDPYTAEPRRKKGKGLLIAAILLLLIGVGLLCGAGYLWWTNQQAYQQNADEYHELASAYVVESTDEDVRPIVDFAALQALNSEIVGWIQIPNTPVNYPVVQTTDNDFYLDHSFLGRYDQFGAIFMDYRSSSDLTDYTTVLYGHHLKNGEMFAKVADYSNQADFDTLKNIYYVTSDDQVHVLAPLCSIVVSGYDVDILQFYFNDLASFQQYVQSLIDRSSARSSTANASAVSHIYMLSTCSYATDNERTILVCTDLNATNAPVVDPTASMNQIQEAADAAAGI